MKDYDTDTFDENLDSASEPCIQYGSVSRHHEEFVPPLRRQPRVVTEEEIARCYTLEESSKRMDEMIESTHNHATGCVEHAPVVPRKCSIKDVQRRSMTIEQFTTKLYATVDNFYNSKK